MINGWATAHYIGLVVTPGVARVVDLPKHIQLHNVI